MNLTQSTMIRTQVYKSIRHTERAKIAYKDVHGPIVLSIKIYNNNQCFLSCIAFNYTDLHLAIAVASRK